MALLSGNVLGRGPVPAQLGERKHPESNYDERAFLAATVGALRLPYGTTRSQELAANRGQQVSRNHSGQVIFVSVAIIPGQPPLVVGFSSSGSGQSSEVQHDFSVDSRFEAVLLPDDTLHARTSAVLRILITEVAF